MTRDRPLLALSRRPGMLTKLVTCQHTQTDLNVKLLPSEIRRTIAEFEKCAARVDDSDSATVTLAIMGIALIADEILHLCQQYRDALSEQGRLGDA